MTAAALLVLALALVLPWTTAYQHGGLGGAEAVSETPRLLFVVASQALVGLWIAARDRWLGVLVVYVALNALRAPLGALPLVVSGYVTFGALVIVAARGLPRYLGRRRLPTDPLGRPNDKPLSDADVDRLIERMRDADRASLERQRREHYPRDYPMPPKPVPPMPTPPPPPLKG